MAPDHQPPARHRQAVPRRRPRRRAPDAARRLASAGRGLRGGPSRRARGRAARRPRATPRRSRPMAADGDADRRRLGQRDGRAVAGAHTVGSRGHRRASAHRSAALLVPRPGTGGGRAWACRTPATSGRSSVPPTPAARPACCSTPTPPIRGAGRRCAPSMGSAFRLPVLRDAEAPATPERLAGRGPGHRRHRPQRRRGSAHARPHRAARVRDGRRRDRACRRTSSRPPTFASAFPCAPGRVAERRRRGGTPGVRGRAPARSTADEPVRLRAASPSIPSTVPLAERMRPRTLDEIVGQDEVIGARPSAARDDRARPAAVDHPLGPAGHRQDHARAADRRPHPRRLRRLQRRARRHQGGQGGDGRRRGAPAPTGHAAPSSSSTRSTASTRRSRTPSCRASRAGDIVLIGATTENPSFEVNAALLSRSKVFVLKPLDETAIVTHPSPRPRGRGARSRTRARRGRRRRAAARWPASPTATPARR